VRAGPERPTNGPPRPSAGVDGSVRLDGGCEAAADGSSAARRTSGWARTALGPHRGFRLETDSEAGIGGCRKRTAAVPNVAATLHYLPVGYGCSRGDFREKLRESSVEEPIHPRGQIAYPLFSGNQNFMALNDILRHGFDSTDREYHQSVESKGRPNRGLQGRAVSRHGMDPG
jgi:hypothetical protein